MIKKIILSAVLILVMYNISQSQERFVLIENELTSMVVDVPGLDENVEFTANNISVSEFIRGLGATHNLNLAIDDDINEKVINNFSDAKVMDVIIYLVKSYNLDIDFSGDILYFKRYIEPTQIKPPKIIELSINDGYLSLNLNQDTLEKVVSSITEKSGYNVLVDHEVKNNLISSYIKSLPIKESLEMIALTNGLTLVEHDSLSFIFKALEQIKLPNRRSDNLPSERGIKDEELIITWEDNLITVQSNDKPLDEIIRKVAAKTNSSYFLYDQIKGTGQLNISNVTFDEFLSYLLNGSEYTFRKENEVYLIGNRSLEGLRKTELIRIENRVVQNVIESIPADLKKDIQISIFEDLNGVVVSGSEIRINEVKRFIREIDQVVPMIALELIIVDVRKSSSFSAGISYGVGGDNVPTTTSGVGGSGGLNATINSGTINTMLNALSGFGNINLGQVGADFYLSIEAMESDGYLKTRMKPKISAVNGKQAEISIGQQEYYLEVKNEIIGTQNPVQSSSQNWKTTNADLKLIVVPIVSSDGQVTLEITVNQSDFTERISDTAPPGTINRTFKSTIRVKDGDMILLGGLEDKTLSKSGSGIPFFYKIPVIRWFFGKRTREKSVSTLNIFLRPTIQY